MTSFFDEKAQQVYPNRLDAFGISVESRHGKASELMEMMAFAQQAALAGVADTVKELWYDSNAAICSFTFSRELTLDDPMEPALFEIAMKTLSHFTWIDTDHHRGEDDE